jgi:uncharacterized protein YggE
MRRRHVLLLAALAGVTILSAPAWPQTSKEATIRVIGHATIETVPDQVIVRIGVASKAPTPSAALDQNSGAARRVIDFAKSFGIGEREIVTEAVNLAPAYKQVRDAGGNFRQEPDGYTANNTVRLKLKDIGRLGQFMRQVLDQGATNIGGVQFGLSEPDKIGDEARAKAVEDATRQAERLADAAKVKLGPLVEIVHPPRVSASFANMPVQAKGLARVGSAVPIESGTLEVTAEVDMTWAIE